MTRQNQIRLWVTALILVAVALDQAVKLWIHSTMSIGEAHEVTSWFWICYVENNGMAFGMEWLPKPVLTIFRLLMAGALGWYVNHLITKSEEVNVAYIMTIAFIIAGALGNIVDCMLYGVIWNYAPIMYGRVIDMLYFPLIHDSAGDVLFFRPVFNIADSYITCAVIAIILFFRNQLNSPTNQSTNQLINQSTNQPINHLAIILLIMIAFVGCRPRGVLSQHKMRSVLYDLHRTDGILQQAGYTYGHDEDLNAYYEAVLEKHGVTQAQFDSSLVWYTANPNRFQLIYPKVVQQLEHDVESAKPTDLNHQEE